jgi:hypothetical protein
MRSLSVLNPVFPGRVVEPGTAPLVCFQYQYAQKWSERQTDKNRPKEIRLQFLLPCCCFVSRIFLIVPAVFLVLVIVTWCRPADLLATRRAHQRFCGSHLQRQFLKNHSTKRPTRQRKKFPNNRAIFQLFANRCALATAYVCHALSSHDKSSAYFVRTWFEATGVKMT